MLGPIAGSSYVQSPLAFHTLWWHPSLSSIVAKASPSPTRFTWPAKTQAMHFKHDIIF